MCTAISFCGEHHFFGRTLDFELSYGEQPIIIPRRFPFLFTSGYRNENHYAMVGMGKLAEGYPLYFDATNEKGLSMAGLLFAGNAMYSPAKNGFMNVASFELIPWVLSQCASVTEARLLLGKLCITNVAFSASLPPSPLHWIIADEKRCVVLEAVKEGVQLYENPVGVLTNNPPLPYHLLHLTEFMQLSDKPPQNNLCGDTPLYPYSRGMGAVGLPGDFSSSSRFVRAAFVKGHISKAATRQEEIMQLFHILKSVEIPCGCVTLENDEHTKTIYTSCCDTQRGVYYYTTYFDSTIYAVNMHAEDLTSDKAVWYPLSVKPRFCSAKAAAEGDAL